MDLTPARRAAIARRLDFISAPFIVLPVASVVLLLSLGIVAAPAGIIGAALSAQRSEGQER